MCPVWRTSCQQWHQFRLHPAQCMLAGSRLLMVDMFAWSSASLGPALIGHCVGLHTAQRLCLLGSMQPDTASYGGCAPFRMCNPNNKHPSFCTLHAGGCSVGATHQCET